MLLNTKRIGLLALLAAASVDAIAGSSFCLSASIKSPYDGTPFSSFIVQLTPGQVDIKSNNVPLAGSACTSLVQPKLGTYSECYPLVGSSVIDENQMVIALRGDNTSTDLGPNVIQSYNYTITLDPNSFNGTLSGDVISVVNGVPKSTSGIGQVVKVACPATTTTGGSQAAQGLALRQSIRNILK